MDVAVSLVLPVFGVIAVGYLSVRVFRLGDAVIDGIDRYVFTFAIPALLFRALANTELPDALPWGLWISYYGGMLAIWAAGFAIARATMRRSVADQIVIGFSGCQGNTVMLGIPITLTAFGEEAGVPLFFILAFHGLILLPTATFLLEMTRSVAVSDGGEDAWRVLWGGMLGSLKNPVIIGLASGIAYGQTGLAIPGPIDGTLEMLGRTAIPCALFALGATLTRYEIKRSIGAAGFASTMKLAVMPLLVFVLTSAVFQLEPLWITVATVLAAMPTGVYSSVLANRFQAAPGAASSTVVLATGTSLLSLTAILNLFL